MLKHLGVEYEYKEYDLKITAEGGMDASEWFGVKQDMPLAFPNLPYFIDGDVKISENLAIMEYICMKWKPELLGNTPEERGIVCMLAGVFDPLRSEVTRASYMNKEREPILE
mgnify:CR=1 FL=1